MKIAKPSKPCKPCPFCGEKAEWEYSFWATVTCLNSHCRIAVSVALDDFLSVEAALDAVVDKWNTRHNEVIVQAGTAATWASQAVRVAETETGSFYVLFQGVAVGHHLNRPSAERNRNEFIAALDAFLRQEAVP